MPTPQERVAAAIQFFFQTALPQATGKTFARGRSIGMTSKRPINPAPKNSTPSQKNTPVIVDAEGSPEKKPKTIAIAQETSHATISPVGTQSASDTVRLLDRVRGRNPVARCDTSATTTAYTMIPMPPRQTRISRA